jgi:peptidoglycan hydrolase FlgJ
MESSVLTGWKNGPEGTLAKGEKKTSALSSAAQDKKLRQACADFESIFFSNLFKEMRRTIPQSGLLPPSPGKDMYQMMLDQKIAEDLSKRGEGMGLQKLLYEQLRRR